jgi:hypothetical protein
MIKVNRTSYTFLSLNKPSRPPRCLARVPSPLTACPSPLTACHSSLTAPSLPARVPYSLTACLSPLTACTSIQSPHCLPQSPHCLHEYQVPSLPARVPSSLTACISKPFLGLQGVATLQELFGLQIVDSGLHVGVTELLAQLWFDALPRDSVYV